MRIMTALFLGLLCYNMWGQPGNDECINATTLNLSQVASCPAEDVVESTFFADNTDATASSTTLQLAADFGNGLMLNAPVADVWFQFVPTSNQLEIEIEGDIQNPVLAIFQADYCGLKIPVDFSLSENSDGKLQRTLGVVPGQLYLIMVAGSDISDQGSFSMRFTAYNDCNTCGRRYGLLKANPAPENGTYQAGQEIEFCYTITSWDPGFSLEWLHGLQLEFGDGWDTNTLSYSLPEACTPGNWNWYDNWESCNTNNSFGPGFAFDAEQGLLCPGASAYDNIPGNNFGDGPCGSLEAAPLPLEFCWTLKVKDNFSSPQERNLNIVTTLLGDGYSGSWMQYSCENESQTTFFATATPAMALLPELTVESPSCESNCNGQLMIDGQGNNTWQYELYDAAGNMVYSTPAFTGSQIVNGLCAGDYEFKLTQSNSNISQSVAINIPAMNLPAVQVGYIPACNEGDAFQLVAGLSSTASNISYSWSGPGNFSSNNSSPLADVHGAYTLQVIIDGCEAPEKTIITQPLRAPITCESDADAITFSWESLPQDTAYEVIVLTGQMGNMISNNSFRVEGLDQEEVVEIELMARGTGFCALSVQEANCQTLACDPPVLSEYAVICAGGVAELEIDATDLASINWGPAASLSCTDCPTPLATPLNTTTYEVTTVSNNGCSVTQSVTVYVNSLPESVLPNEPVTYCAGLPFEFCLPEENRYLWISPIGFIQSGNCISFPYTNGSIAGEYLIRVRLPNGCQFYEILTLEPDPACSIGLSNPTPVIPFNGNDFDDRAPSSLSVFPNPTNGFIHINMHNTDSDMKKLTLYNLTGSPVMELQSTQSRLKLNLSSLEAGSYVLHIVGANGHWQEKIVVSH
ncbi:MAG: T9SS type A sorting domain-containing protein [Chitinophagales bacterium]|nr:T9SS type A sorting domain-containing protein [Chitinophagales bacterium]